MKSLTQRLCHPKVWGHPLTAPRLVVYLIGCLTFALGADSFIASNEGTDPLDVFVLGLRKHVPMTIGMGQAGVAVVCIIVWALWTRRRPVWTPFATFAFCGSVIDLLQFLKVASYTHLGPISLMIVAGLLCAYGSALILMSGIGIRAMDLIAIGAREKISWPFWLGKSSVELVLLVVGKVLGGPAGIGTIYFLASVDLLIQPLVLVTARCGVLNLGLPPSRKLADGQLGRDGVV